jgi:hypothetical protein
MSQRIKLRGKRLAPCATPSVPVSCKLHGMPEQLEQQAQALGGIAVVLDEEDVPPLAVARAAVRAASLPGRLDPLEREPHGQLGART